MSLFQGISIGSGGALPALPFGQYVVKIVDVKSSVTRKKVKAIDFIYEVVETSNKEVEPGLRSNQYCQEDQDVGLYFLKLLMVVANGLDPAAAADQKLINSEDWDAQYDALRSNGDLYKDRLIRLSVVPGSNKKGEPYRDGKKLFSVHESQRAKLQDALAKAGKK